MVDICSIIECVWRASVGMWIYLEFVCRESVGGDALSRGCLGLCR